MTDIVLPYTENSISGSFSWDIKNNQNELTIIADSLSAGNVVVAVMDDSNERTIHNITTSEQVVIGPLKAARIRLIGTGVTAGYIRVA